MRVMAVITWALTLVNLGLCVMAVRNVRLTRRAAQQAHEGRVKAEQMLLQAVRLAALAPTRCANGWLAISLNDVLHGREEYFLTRN